MKRNAKTLMTAIAVAVVSTSLSTQAAVLVSASDNGSITPTVGANDAGYTGASNQRFGWDINETFGQTFTLANAGIIDSIYIGYNGFADTDDITLELSVNGGVVASGIFLDGINFSGDQATDTNSSPVYWMQFDLSGDPVAVSAGLNSFSLTATAESEGGGGATWIFAPMRNTTNPYAGGVGTGSALNADSLFAVTVVVPEPGSLALLGLGGLALMLCRRRCRS